MSPISKFLLISSLSMFIAVNIETRGDCFLGSKPYKNIKTFGVEPLKRDELIFGKDQTKKIQAAMNGNSKAIFFPPGEYLVTNTISVPDGVSIYGYGARLNMKKFKISPVPKDRSLNSLKKSDKIEPIQIPNLKIEEIEANEPIFEIKSNVSICGIKLKGTGQGRKREAISNHHGIAQKGTPQTQNPPLFANNLEITDVTISDISRNGIHLAMASNFKLKNVEIFNYGYSGVAMSSCKKGLLLNLFIHGEPSGDKHNNAYGISASRQGGDLISHPDSSLLLIQNCRVEDVISWHGIDTHGGQGLTILNPIIRNCRVGIALTTNSLDYNNPNDRWSSPSNCKIINPLIEMPNFSYNGDGAAFWVFGIQDSESAPITWARNNEIIGGQIQGYGNSERQPVFFIDKTEELRIEKVLIDYGKNKISDLFTTKGRVIEASPGVPNLKNFYYNEKILINTPQSPKPCEKNPWNNLLKFDVSLSTRFLP